LIAIAVAGIGSAIFHPEATKSARYVAGDRKATGMSFFTIGGIPGSFPLTPWPGNPGFFWGFTTVPFGASARSAIIAAHFSAPGGHSVVVHSTAPLNIDGTRHSSPAWLRYAVFPQLIGRPASPHRLVVFRQLEPLRTAQTGFGAPRLRVIRSSGQTITIRSEPVRPIFGRPVLPLRTLPLRPLPARPLPVNLPVPRVLPPPLAPMPVVLPPRAAPPVIPVPPPQSVRAPVLPRPPAPKPKPH